MTVRRLSVTTAASVPFPLEVQDYDTHTASPAARTALITTPIGTVGVVVVWPLVSAPAFRSCPPDAPPGATEEFESRESARCSS